MPRGSPATPVFLNERSDVKDTDAKRVETHLRRTFGANGITLKARPKQKDSCEVYIGEEFIGVVYEDEDEEGSFMFEMAILSEDLVG